ncbi:MULTISPECIES: hypothetical protein [Streptomyces]|uniref:Uncharacterized protein n=1 Tax=Streptomyces sviceus (strain ATCC 29083 / DSM 924 / JCM 4929 / NBRC 13980 / NCIMB 11184 / NRRL 5439 / UC 5370) TaxID=463191 RepID=B5I1I9_STRX2|nr:MULTISPECIES: hypothetical protein [Streptomyces]EDY58944.1 conserved hypothetical protein [Streptomyces sviceus ATCC 29083]MYT09956.1 hypothetical protein [Streptomyces sp. SID5470]
MISGYVIGESLRPGAEFAPRGLRLRKVSRVEVAGASGGQPPAWTLVEWESDGEDVGALADALAEALEPELGWYADFVAGDERVVVFAGKVFRYRRGDEAGRAEAVAYGRSVGTPEHQLDWEE